MSGKVLIEVDGLPVKVDEVEYESNPDGVIHDVRQARAGVRLTDADGNDEPDGFSEIGKSL